MEVKVVSLKYMILGLVKEFPAYGYDILRVVQRDFAEQGPEINKGQLYTLIKKMEEEGLIVREVVQQDKTPNRKLIKITPLGEADFDNWLRSDTEENENIRYDFYSKYAFLNKVNHFNKLSNQEVLEKLDRQLKLMEEKYTNFVKARDSMLNKKVDQFRVFIIEYGIEIQKAKIEWLKRLRNHVSINY
jgi:DNA-binding PadR family transcriptional regulator